MYRNKIKVLMPFLLLMISCQENKRYDSKSKEIIKTELSCKTKEFGNDVRMCVIIPGGGCPGCIASGLSFVVKHKSDFAKTQKRNVVVFTNISSMKGLRRHLKDASIAELNCIVDTANSYLVDVNENIYPIILKIDNKKIVEVAFQSPQENGLYDME